MINIDWQGGLQLLAYLAVLSGSIKLVDYLFNVPYELYRKAYHIMIAFAILILLYRFENWYSSIITLAVFIITTVIFIEITVRLGILNKLPIARNRKTREISRQAISLLVSYGFLITVFWGFLGGETRYIAVLSVMSWGFGDAAAALIGKYFGCHRLKHSFFNKNKTIEGLLAMFISSSCVIFIVLMVYELFSIGFNIFSALVLGMAAALIEASSRDGWDTLFVPVILAILAYPILQLLVYVEGALF